MLSGVGLRGKCREWEHQTAPCECPRSPQTPRRCPARDGGLGPGADASTPPASVGPRALPGAFRESTRLRMRWVPETDHAHLSHPPSECCAPASPASPLEVVVMCPLLAPPTCPRALGGIPPAEEGVDDLVSNSLTPNSGT